MVCPLGHIQALSLALCIGVTFDSPWNTICGTDVRVRIDLIQDKYLNPRVISAAPNSTSLSCG